MTGGQNDRKTDKRKDGMTDRMTIERPEHRSYLPKCALVTAAAHFLPVFHLIKLKNHQREMISTILRLRLRVTSLVDESASTEPSPLPRRHKPITNGMPLKRGESFSYFRQHRNSCNKVNK
jgi:hypothetical protein